MLDVPTKVRPHVPWLDVAGLTLFAVALRVPALFAARHLTFDDGVYGASAQAMRAGGWPFRDVFSSQGPLFLPLVWIPEMLGFGWRQSPRLLAVAAGIALTLAAWSIARRVATPERARVAGLAAGALVAVSGSVLWTTGPVASDGPALAFAAWAIDATLRWRAAIDEEERSFGASTLVGIGLLAGAAFAIKSLLVVAPLLVVAAMLVTARPSGRPPVRAVLVAGGCGIAVVALATLVMGPADVWNQWIVYHLVHAGDREPFANAGRIVGVLFSREWILMAVGAVTVGWLLLGRIGVRPRAALVVRSTGPLWWWLGLSAITLLLETPMWRPHVVYLTVPLAILLALALPPWPVATAAALIGAIPFALVMAPYFAPDDYAGRRAEIVAAIQSLPANRLVISDDPGLVWGAGRATPPWMVDASRLRTGTDVEAVRIDAALIADEALGTDVCMVVVTSSRFADIDGLTQALHAAGYRPAIDYGDNRAVWIRASPRCMR